MTTVHFVTQLDYWNMTEYIEVKFHSCFEFEGFSNTNTAQRFIRWNFTALRSHGSSSILFCFTGKQQKYSFHSFSIHRDKELTDMNVSCVLSCRTKVSLNTADLRYIRTHSVPRQHAEVLISLSFLWRQMLMRECLSLQSFPSLLPLSSTRWASSSLSCSQSSVPVGLVQSQSVLCCETRSSRSTNPRTEKTPEQLSWRYNFVLRSCRSVRAQWLLHTHTHTQEKPSQCMKLLLSL